MFKLGLNLLLGGRGGNFISTNCFTALAKSGNVIGKDDSIPLGASTLDPEYLSSGTYIYALRADVTTGAFELRLGVAGDEQEPNTNLFIYEYKGDHVELSWDGTSKYTGTDLTMATTLNALVGSKVCVRGVGIPYLLIDYTYETLETE